MADLDIEKLVEQEVDGVPADAGEVTSAASVESPVIPKTTEVFGGYPVHPAAALFPLMIGVEFDELVESIRRTRTVTPVEIHEGKLIDGRNRCRAVEQLQREGEEIELPTTEWHPNAGESVEEHIFAVNVCRRHLTDDQRVAIGISFLPSIRRRCQERQAATRFGQREAAAQISSLPGGPAAAERTSREKDADSTVGQFAAMLNIGLHKSRQGVALEEGVEAGEISSVEVIAVAKGAKRLRDIVPTKRPSSRKKPVDKESLRPEAEPFFDAEPVDVDEPAPTEAEVRLRWERFKQLFAVADHRELRRLLKQIIVEEQRQFDQ